MPPVMLVRSISVACLRSSSVPGEAASRRARRGPRSSPSRSVNTSSRRRAAPRCPRARPAPGPRRRRLRRSRGLAQAALERDAGDEERGRLDGRLGLSLQVHAGDEPLAARHLELDRGIGRAPGSSPRRPQIPLSPPVARLSPRFVKRRRDMSGKSTTYAAIMTVVLPAPFAPSSAVTCRSSR